MKVEEVIKVLKSDTINDPEDLLDWLAIDGLEVLEEYVRLREMVVELENHTSLLRDALHYSTFVVNPTSTFFDIYLDRIQRAVDAGAITYFVERD